MQCDLLFRLDLASLDWCAVIHRLWFSLNSFSGCCCYWSVPVAFGSLNYSGWCDCEPTIWGWSVVFTCFHTFISTWAACVCSVITAGLQFSENIKRSACLFFYFLFFGGDFVIFNGCEISGIVLVLKEKIWIKFMI